MDDDIEEASPTTLWKAGMTETPEALMEAYERAANEHDLDAMLNLIDDEAIYLFSDETVHAGKGAIARAIGRNFDLIQNETYAIVDLTWLAQSEEVAACVYNFFWSGAIDGEPASGSGRGTTVVRRSGAGWKVIHEHLSKGRFGA